MTTCLARKGADGQMRCGRCRTSWDADDKDPPPCGVTLQFVAVDFGKEPGVSVRQLATGGKIVSRPVANADGNRRWDGTLRAERERLPFASGLPLVPSR